MNDPHDEALAELKALFDADSSSLDARLAVRALLTQKPLKLLVVCVDPSTAIWTDDTCTARKFVAEPSDLLLEIMAAARTAEWEKIIVLVHEITPSSASVNAAA